MYWTLFLTFVKIGTFTIGGGYAMLPLIQREVVDKGWLSKEDFIDLFSVVLARHFRREHLYFCRI